MRDWQIRSLGSEFRWLGGSPPSPNALGLPALGALVGSEAVVRAAASAQLDGLLAIWQPPLTD